MLLMGLHCSIILIWLPSKHAVFSHQEETADLCTPAIIWQVLICMHSFVLLHWLNERSTDQLEQMCVCVCSYGPKTQLKLPDSFHTDLALTITASEISL